MSASAPHRNVADLTNWFLNAKRSLTSVTYCTRGNEIITSTRNAVIDASIMAARTTFLQGGIKDELKLLQRARSVMENQRDAARKEFQVSIAELDEANHRLDAILSSLRTTEVETAFSTQDKAEQKQRALYDFVDEDGIENLRSQLRGIIDQVQEDDPETEEDKANMLAVLEKDAGEVDDVVNEIKERLDEMEATSVLVEKTVRDIGDHYRCVLGLLGKMRDGQNLLVTCTAQSKEFVYRQRDNQEVIAERLDELQRLTDHYVLFRDAYDALLVEVGRRMAVQRQKDAIIQDALARIDMLNEGDLNEREQFRSDSIRKDDVGNRPKYILLEDRAFVGIAKLVNQKASIRRRIYSERSILKPNSYDVLTDISCFHYREQMLRENYELPWLPAVSTRTHARPRAKKQPDTAQETRNPKRTATHQQASLRIRAASLSYLVRKFVLGGRHEDVLRLYTDIQNSWLTAEQRELDATVYFKALLDAFSTKPAPSGAVIAQVINNYEAAYGTFDRFFQVGRTHTFRERVAPRMLLFLSANLPLREALPTIKSEATHIHSQTAGDEILPQVYRNLNRSLIISQKPSADPINRDTLRGFYIGQSKILNDLSKIPRTAAANGPLAKVFLKQAVTWEEVLEAKRLILDSPDRSDIITYQSALMRSLHRLSPFATPGSIYGRSMVELLTDIRWLFNLKGCARQRGTFIGIAASIYARLGVFRALELLLDAVDAVKRPYNISATYLRETIQYLTVSMQSRAAVRKDTKSRAVGIAMRVFQLHLTCVSPSVRQQGALQIDSSSPPRDAPHLHKGLIRDLVHLLALCGGSAAIRDVWQTILWVTSHGNIDRSTLETILDGLLITGDVQYAMEVLNTIPAATGGQVTASTIRPFLTAAVNPPDALSNDRIPLDEVVRIGIQSNLRWGSVSHIYFIRSQQDQNCSEAVRDARIRRAEAWARAMQACANEMSHEQQHPGTVLGQTLTKIEEVLRDAETDTLSAVAV
ncbi:hypothetical protein ABW21_db0206843 [Orbilia brochopaga]|nr:hypothetical protein ABW21_db0206843 [Drechslerella brochopaga]